MKHTDDFGRLAATVFEVCATILEIVPHGNSNNKQDGSVVVIASYFIQFCRLALQVFADGDACVMARAAATEFVVFAVAVKPMALKTEGLPTGIVQVACEVALREAAARQGGRRGMGDGGNNNDNNNNNGAAVIGGDMADEDEGDDDEDYDDEEDDDDDSDEGDLINLALRVLHTIAKRPELSRMTFKKVMASITHFLSSTNNTTTTTPTTTNSSDNTQSSPLTTTTTTRSPSSSFPATFSSPSSSPARAAAYSMLSAIAKGCAHDVTQHVGAVVPLVVSGVVDDAHGAGARAGALEALAYVCEALDADELGDDVVAKVSTRALDVVLAALHHGKGEGVVARQGWVTL